MIGPVQAVGLTMGGLYVADRWKLVPPAEPAPPGSGSGSAAYTHITTAAYTETIAWAQAQYPYRTSSLIEAAHGGGGFYGEDLAAGLAVWGPIATDDNIPAWSIETCIKVLNRWASIGERFQSLSALHFDFEAPGRINSALDSVRHRRNELLKEPDKSLSWGFASIDTDRVIFKLATAIAAEGDGDYIPQRGLGEIFVDRLEDVGGTVAGAVGGAIGTVVGGTIKGVGGALFRSLATPLGAGALLLGAWVAHRRGWL